MDHAENHEYGGIPGMKGMDHGSGGMAPGVPMKNGKYTDERFIDAMVPHHEGAVELARIVVKNAKHPEIEHLADETVAHPVVLERLESIAGLDIPHGGI